MAFRVAQISDTHLSGAKPFFAANFKLVAAALAASAPDLVLNTGDVSLDGDRRYAPHLRAFDRIHHPGRAPATLREKEVGYVEHRFEPDSTHGSAFVRVPGLRHLDNSDFAEAAYGVKL